MRVLHLLHPWIPHPPAFPGSAAAPDAMIRACAQSMLLAPEHTHRVLIIGPAAAADRAARLGVRSEDRLCPALNAPALAAPALRRYLQERPRPDAVQLWGTSLVPLAALALRHLDVYVPDLPGSPSTPTPNPNRTSASATAAPSRAEARARLGIEMAEPVVGLIGDPPGEVDARWFFMLLGTLEFAGVRVAGVAPAGVGSFARARRLRRSSGRSFDVAVVDAPPHEWLAACDVAVLPPAQTITESSAARGHEVRFAFAGAAATAASLGIPVVCDPLFFTCDWLPESARDACAMKRTLPARAAAQVLALVESPSMRARVGEALRERALAACPVRGAAAATAAAWSAGSELPFPAAAARVECHA